MKYTIEQTSPLLPYGCSLIARYAGLRIGYAHITISQSVATLSDIQVSVITVKPFIFLPFYKKIYNYRNKGVGSALLKQVINICEESGISEIFGQIQGNEEMLKDWYKKFGFEVNGKEIRLYLNNNAKPYRNRTVNQ